MAAGGEAKGAGKAMAFDIPVDRPRSARNQSPSLQALRLRNNQQQQKQSNGGSILFPEPRSSASTPRPRPKTVPASYLSDQYNWEQQRLIGKGRCTNCHEVVAVPRKSDSKIVAIRKIGSPICRSVDVSDALSEVQKLSKVPQHKNIIAIRSLIPENGQFELEIEAKPFVEMEFYRTGSLNGMIQKKFELRGSFTPRQVVSYMHQLTSAVLFLHQHDVLHRDIRPKNIFIIDDGVLKLGDVGGPKVVQ